MIAIQLLALHLMTGRKGGQVRCKNQNVRFVHIFCLKINRLSLKSVDIEGWCIFVVSTGLLFHHSDMVGV